MAVIFKMAANRCWQGDGHFGMFIHCWWDGQQGSGYGKAWQVLKGLNMELSFDQAIYLLVPYLQRIKNKTLHRVIHRASFTIIRKRK
jgi:hypothetical protein